MYHVVYCILFVFVCWLKGDWKNWRKYYPTILFFALGEMELNFIFYKHSLWEYTSPNFTHTFITFLWDGWNLAYSTVFDILIFMLLYLHFKKPLFACFVVIFLIPLFIHLTKLPLNNIK